jgi:hypothetical protein
MVRRLHQEKSVNKKQTTKLVSEGEYVAEVDIELIITNDGWSPYLSLEDAYRLDQVRQALRQGDIAMAASFGRIYKLTPVAV